MPVMRFAVIFKAPACLAILAISIAVLTGCQKKKETSPPDEPKTATSASAATPVPDEPAAAPDSIPAGQPQENANAKVPAHPAAPAPPRFSSRPVLKANLGKAWRYRAALSTGGVFSVKIVTAPDSSMTADKGVVSWTPVKAGRYPVVLEAVIAAGAPAASASAQAGKAGSAPIRQNFILVVENVLTLALKPLPAQVGKGDTVAFDLRGSVFPAWAADQIRVRFDYEGDGRWDTEALPLAANLLHRFVYDTVGRFAPKVEARYQDLEIRSASGAVTVVSAVTPVLKISPDTVEPGGNLFVDASESKADGVLAFSLDVNGDGKPDWIDSSSSKATLKAPASGVYTAVLTARNSMGQEGKATAKVLVNAAPKLELKVKNAKDNMAAQIEFKAKARDADDSLIKVRCNFTGEANGWEVRTAAPDSVLGPGEWWLHFKHAYGKVGVYTASFCAVSADGREACQQAKIEIFNAPPVCQPGLDLKATLGKPLDIDGTGVDPDGKIVKWEWDLDGDGKYDLVSTANGKFQYTFSKVGVFPLTLRVTSADGATAKAIRKVEVRKKWKS